MKKLFLLLVLGVTLASCYMARKIEKPISFRVEIYSDVQLYGNSENNNRYINNKTPEEYKKAFLDGLRQKAGYEENVTLIESDTVVVDYILQVFFLSVSESERTETVNDPNSPHHGKSYNLTKVKASASFRILNNMGENLSKDLEVDADREEKLKNSRNLGQIIIGTNKDNTLYREKLLSDDIAYTLSENLGGKVYGVFTQKVKKDLKD